MSETAPRTLLGSEYLELLLEMEAARFRGALAAAVTAYGEESWAARRLDLLVKLAAALKAKTRAAVLDAVDGYFAVPPIDYVFRGPGMNEGVFLRSTLDVAYNALQSAKIAASFSYGSHSDERKALIALSELMFDLRADEADNARFHATNYLAGL